MRKFKVLEDRLEQWKGVEKLGQLREVGARALAKPEKSKKAGGKQLA